MKKENIYIHCRDNYDYKTLILFADYSDELISFIEKKINKPIKIVGFREINWEEDFSPWPFQQFKGKGKKTIEEALKEEKGEVLVAGYSLGGLLGLVALADTRITGCASVSGSLWYPGLEEYLLENRIENRHIYLSLGDRECKTRHSLMKTVADKTLKVNRMLQEKNDVFFKWNPGNHFDNVHERLADGIAYLINKR